MNNFLLAILFLANASKVYSIERNTTSAIQTLKNDTSNNFTSTNNTPHDELQMIINPTSKPSTSFPTELPTTRNPTINPTANPSKSPIHHPENTCEFSQDLFANLPCIDHLSPYVRMYSDAFICSENKRYRFGMTKDELLCLCDNNRKLWCAEDCCSLGNKPYATLTDRGYLVVYSNSGFFGQNNNLIWYKKGSSMKRRDNIVARVTNDGNLKIIEGEEKVIIWQIDKSSWKPYSDLPTPSPTTIPSQNPTFYPTEYHPHGPVSFFPGVLENDPSNSVRLSQGLTMRLIAKSGKKVVYTDGSKSKTKVHGMPDAGGCFDQPDGSWVYVSNSELPDNKGGVGSFTFDKDGNLMEYKMIQTNTNMNCGGGKTPWDTWFSGEETTGGNMYEIDPTGNTEPKLTDFGKAKFESAVCDARFMLELQLQCFATVDKFNGALRRLSPPRKRLEEAVSSNDFSFVLYSNDRNYDGEVGNLTYLVLDPSTFNFHWTTNLTHAELNAEAHYPNTEGIDHYDGKLYVTSKKLRQVFILDLDNQTYESSSTESGTFDKQPDQVKLVIGNQHDNNKGSSSRQKNLLFFLEDGGKAPGIFALDIDTKEKFTVLEKIPSDEISNEEVTGLAFCDDFKRMIFAFQETGDIYEVTRDDKRPFYGRYMNVKYHSDISAESGGTVLLRGSSDV